MAHVCCCYHLRHRKYDQLYRWRKLFKQFCKKRNILNWSTFRQMQELPIRIEQSKNRKLEIRRNGIQGPCPPDSWIPSHCFGSIAANDVQTIEKVQRVAKQTPVPAPPSIRKKPDWKCLFQISPLTRHHRRVTERNPGSNPVLWCLTMGKFVHSTSVLLTQLHEWVPGYIHRWIFVYEKYCSVVGSFPEKQRWCLTEHVCQGVKCKSLWAIQRIGYSAI